MRSCAAALTLAFSLGVVSTASAQESGNWFTRMLAPTPAADKTDPDKSADKDDAPKITPAVNRSALKAAKKAKADWERRVDVCDRLRRIADETDDEDLRRKVDRLEQRAWDVYLAAKNIAADPESPDPEPDAKKGGRK